MNRIKLSGRICLVVVLVFITGLLPLATDLFTYNSVLAKGGSKVNLSIITDIKVEGVDFTEGSFTTQRNEYSTFVPFSVSGVKVCVTAPGGEIKINDTAAISGEASEPIPLAVGNNIIKITAVSGNEKEEVVLTFNRYQDPDILYKETYRPQFHNSPPMFLMNDPNGLVYNEYTGEYHLFYQYDAKLKEGFESKVWAHAVSKDLVYWEQRPIAIYPDQWGQIYSGSAVIDKDNTSGLFDESTPPGNRMVAFFTYYSGMYGDSSLGNQIQGLAYSTDGGTNWTKYDRPIITDEKNEYSDGFRDPKVVWYEDPSYENGGIWLMAIGGGKIRLFASENLIDWEYQSNITRENGKTPITTECPDLFQIAVNGDENNKRWVYMGSLYNNGDSKIVYVIGDIVKDETGKFKFVTEAVNLRESLNSNCEVYAQQTFYNDAKGRRIAISWIRDWVSFNEEGTMNIKNWLGTHTLPVELVLKYDNGEYYFLQVPVEELKSLRYPQPMFSVENKVVGEDDDNILAGLTGKMYEIEAEFTLGSAKSFGFALRKSTGEGIGEETIVSYDVDEQRIVLDRIMSGIAMSGGGSIMFAETKPDSSGKVKIRILVDTSIIDIYGNNGESVINTQIYPSQDSLAMEFFVKKGDVTIDSLKIYQLDSIHFSQLKGDEGDEDPDKDNAEGSGKTKFSNKILLGIIGAELILVGIGLGIAFKVIDKKKKGK